MRKPAIVVGINADAEWLEERRFRNRLLRSALPDGLIDDARREVYRLHGRAVESLRDRGRNLAGCDLKSLLPPLVPALSAPPLRLVGSENAATDDDLSLPELFPHLSCEARQSVNESCQSLGAAHRAAFRCLDGARWVDWVVHRAILSAKQTRYDRAARQSKVGNGAPGTLSIDTGQARSKNPPGHSPRASRLIYWRTVRAADASLDERGESRRLQKRSI